MTPSSFGCDSSTSGVADCSGTRARLRVTGADCIEFLQGQCTNDVKKLMVQQSCYAAFLSAKGKMRGEGHIIRLPDAFLLETNHGLASSLEKFIITEDVVIEDVSATFQEYLVVGDLKLPAGAIAFEHPLGLGVISPTRLPVSVDADTFEVMRIEAGVPAWGVDMDENTIPVEAGLEKRAISYEKGCYIGQETIARIKTYGHVNRQLVQLAMEGDQVPARGMKIMADVREAGQVTSAVRSMRLGKVVALGYVRREFAKAGTKLNVNNELAEVLKICGE